MFNRVLLISLVILTGEAIQAAPLPPGPPPVRDRKQLRNASRRYAQQLRYFVNRISDQYVREVKREDLLEAALKGLYEAARQPVPHDLRLQVRQAVNLESVMHTSAGNVPPPGVIAQTDHIENSPVEKMLVRLRERLGDAPGLEGADPLVVSCRSLARLLDPHSGIVTEKDQHKALRMDAENIGVGLEFRENVSPGPMVIERVHMGSPAQRAGIRPGDVITHVADKPAAEAVPEKVMALRNHNVPDNMVMLARPMPDPDQTPANANLPRSVRVKYTREGVKDPREVTLYRERYRPETVLGVRRMESGTGWDFMLDEKEKIAHIRVTALSRGTSEEMREALGNLQSRRVKGVILDLRWCPGGYLNEAVETADHFLGTCVIATTQSRNQPPTTYRSTEEGKFQKFSLVVLVNSDTSGGAELIAAALQDHKRATVVGQRTRGKASVQIPLSLGLEGIGFKLTTGTFLRPSGKNLHRFPESQTRDDWGVVPDEDCRVTKGLSDRLQQWWEWQSLRPTKSNERLPLDDPRGDPQQRMALEVVREMVKKKE